MITWNEENGLQNALEVVYPWIPWQRFRAILISCEASWRTQAHKPTPLMAETNLIDS